MGTQPPNPLDHHLLQGPLFEVYALTDHGDGVEGLDIVDPTNDILINSILRNQLSDYLGMNAMRQFLLRVSAFDLSGMTDRGVIAAVADHLCRGKAALIKLPAPETPCVEAQQPEERARDSQSDVKAVQRTTWITIQVIDHETGQPIAGAQLQLDLPGQTRRAVTTGADGDVEISGIHPGSCDVSCDLSGSRLEDTLSLVGLGRGSTVPGGEAGRGEAGRGEAGRGEAGRGEAGRGEAGRGEAGRGEAGRGEAGRGEAGRGDSRGVFASTGGGQFKVAMVRRQRGRPAETFEQLASRLGLSAAALARFNWGLEDKDAIEEHLCNDVGCSERNGAGQFVFGDDDRPGYVHVPRPLSVQGLPTGQVHTLRVQRLSTDRQVLGHVWVRLVSPFDYPLGRIPCRLTGGGGGWAAQVTSDDGVVHWDGLPLDEDYEVLLELGGRSLRIPVPWMRRTYALHQERVIDADDLLDGATAAHGSQVRLLGLGYDPGPINGAAGGQTAAAVEAFQQEHGLRATGKLGPGLEAVLADLFGA